MNSSFVVVGTDTDAGKTGFCAQFLHAFAGEYAYWKPVETGESDTATIRRFVPSARVFDPLMHFVEPVAPMLAAQRAGLEMPSIPEVTAAIPESDWRIVIESFGGPLSPFCVGALQAELFAAFRLPFVLVTSSAVGAVARALQAMAGLREFGLKPSAVVLMGSHDEFAVEQIERFGCCAVVSLERAASWDAEGIQSAVAAQSQEFERLRSRIANSDTSQGRHAGDNPLSVVERDRAAVWHPYTPLVPVDDPLVVAGADAEFLHLADGRRLIDGISSWWTILHGHRHAPLVTALRDASRTWDHVHFAGVTHEPAVELAERLLATMPWTGGRVFFSDNGSTAVEAAMKMAYQAWCHRGEPERKLFIGFEHGYHGDTFGAMAAGRDPLFFGRFEPFLFETIRIPVSGAAFEAAMRQRGGEVAGVILEPLVQGAGGMRMHSPEELRAIFDLTRRHGVYFLADEVMTGLGRTGTFWAFDRAGIAPDLVCTSKTLAGGMLPLAATVAAPGIVELFHSADRTKTFFHGHSFTGHPLACAVAVANFRGLAAGHWQRDVSRIESVWNSRFAELVGRTDLQFRTCGTIAAIEFASPDGYLADIGRRLRMRCLKRGVLLRPLGNVLYAMPPYRTSDDSLHRIADAMLDCVAAETHQ